MTTNININMHIYEDLSVKADLTVFSEENGYIAANYDQRFIDPDAAFVGLKLLIAQALEDAKE